MKTLFIGMSLIACLYSAQHSENTKQPISISSSPDLDDSVVYGPTLPCYYSNAVSEYVRRIFQDSRGFLWFGTNTDGLALFDGYKLSYLNTDEGLIGSQITGIMEDKEGKIWFSTNNGISRFDLSAASGKEFQNFGEQEGLNNKSTWCIFQDRKGTIWVGTFQGLCRFNGKNFESFPIPTAEKSWIRSITEDRKGNLWVATAEKGAFKFDGNTFRQFSSKDGLCSNDLTCILEDKQENIWFGSMDGGISKYNPSEKGKKAFENFNSEKGIGGNEVWTIYEDSKGTIWFSCEGSGVYIYQNQKIYNFNEKQGLHMNAVQAFYQDRFGLFWIGGGGGLVRFTENSFRVITKDGPWDDGC
ncbi:two-component regulator propeller domain-containing protein [Fluviicola taffensis]|uniref:ligand-binding sensor domain-containing protein n=1 Tax=Fluviicola taffensis TaxID=191579 RepID=UPI00313780E1